MRDTIRILHVEDNEFDVQVFRALLAKIPSTEFVIDDAKNIKEALTKLRTSAYNLILLDLKLPDSFGLDTFLKVHESHPTVPIIVLSGEDDKKTATGAVELGAQDYLTKGDVNAKTLVNSITYALERHRRLWSLESQRDELMRAIDRLTCGVMLVDASGRILRSNRSARAILKEQDGLYEQNGHLRATDKEEARALQELISSKTSRGQGTAGHGGHITITRKEFIKPLSVVVTPIESTKPSRNCAAAAIFVTNPDQDLQSLDNIMQQRYKLTRAEAKLASLILQGYGAEEAAKMLDNSYHTVRTHLKHIYQKTGTTRQSDLVRLILSGPICFPNPPEEH